MTLREINARMSELEDAQSSRELTDAEKSELKRLQAKFDAGVREAKIAGIEQSKKGSQVSEQSDELREFIKAGKPGVEFELRETGTVRTNVAEVESKVVHAPLDSAPYAETVYDKAGCPIQYGVKGLNSWPFVNNATVSIKNELTAIGDGDVIDFTKIDETRVRLTAKIVLSWQAIEDSAVDLVALAHKKISQAFEQTLNHVACSNAKWNANFYGGFAHASKQTTTYPSTGFTFAKAMEMVGAVAAKEYGIDGGVFVMGATDFYALKATPKDSGSGLMVIDDNNRIGGFPVMIDNNINRTAVKGAISGNNIGFGLFKFLPCLQHGNVRMTIDANSATAADVDGVYLICNADWSMTDLRPDAFILASKAS